MCSKVRPSVRMCKYCRRTCNRVVKCQCFKFIRYGKYSFSQIRASGQANDSIFFATLQAHRLPHVCSLELAAKRPMTFPKT